MFAGFLLQAFLKQWRFNSRCPCLELFLLYTMWYLFWQQEINLQKYWNKITKQIISLQIPSTGLIINIIKRNFRTHFKVTKLCWFCILLTPLMAVSLYQGLFPYNVHLWEGFIGESFGQSQSLLNCSLLEKGPRTLNAPVVCISVSYSSFVKRYFWRSSENSVAPHQNCVFAIHVCWLTE